MVPGSSDDTTQPARQAVRTTRLPHTTVTKDGSDQSFSTSAARASPKTKFDLWHRRLACVSTAETAVPQDETPLFRHPLGKRLLALFAILSLVQGCGLSSFLPGLLGGGIFDPFGDPGALGACCLPNASCIETTRGACAVSFGLFNEGEGCSTTACPSVPGACCLFNGNCIVVTIEDCDAQLGVFLGEAFPCGLVPCSGP